MKYSITNTEGFSLATMTQPRSKTVVTYISIDVHHEQTARVRATELLYTDALISGAGKYNREQFLDALNILGATISAGISDGILTFFIRSRADVFKKVVLLLETMLLEPHFDATELKRIKQTVTNLIKESKEDSRAIAHEQLRNSFYGQQDRRYTFDEDTLIEAISKVTKKDLQSFHKRVCSLTFTCSMAGRTEEVSTMQKGVRGVKTKYPTLSGDTGIHQQKPPAPGLILKNIPSRQNIDFSIGAPIPITLHHPDYLPLMFGVAILGGPSFSSRLMSTVREKEGLTYDIRANTETFYSEEQGYWRVSCFFAPEKTIEGLTATFREVKKIFQKGITQGELERYQKVYLTKQALLKDSTARQLNDLHAYHMQKFSLEEIVEHKNRVHTLTFEEVNAAIKMYLNPNLLTVSGAGPTVTVKKSLQAFMETVA